MTHLLQMAVRMLELDRAGIATMVAEQLECNPLLEQVAVAEPGDDSVVAVVDRSLDVCVVQDAVLQVRSAEPKEGGSQKVAVQPLPFVADDQQDDQLDYEKLRRDGAWLVRALEQRGKTIQQLVDHLAQHSASYFMGEVDQVNATSIRAIAEALSLHESTIRRLASNKALRCTHGVVLIAQLVQQ